MTRIALIALLLISCAGLGQDREVTFGLVIDGPSEYLAEDVIRALENEITILLERDFTVRFPQRFSLDSGYDPEKIAANLETLLAEPEVDMVLCVGVLSCMVASGKGPYEKPVFAPFGIGAELPIYPMQDGGSGVGNFNYVITPANMQRDLTLIKRMEPVEKVYIIAYELFLEAIPGLVGLVGQLADRTDLDLELLRGDNDPEAILEALPDDARMVYVTPLARMTRAQKKILFRGLAERKILSFSMLGREEVELGALAGLAPESDMLRWFRRQALNIQRTLLGEEPGTLPVLFKENTALTLNMETARTIGWFPSWALQIEAELINEEPSNKGRTLTLDQVVQAAVADNPGLRAAARELEIGELLIETARASKGPTVEGDASHLRVDEDTSAASLGSQPEHTTDATLTGSQLLYSDGANAAITIQNRLQEARRQAFEIEKLDVALDAAQRFLTYLSARTLYRFRAEHLDLTASNLETAVVRRDVGIGNPAEVYRWESKLADDRLAAITAKNQADVARYALNEVLNKPLEGLIEALPPDRFDPRLRTGIGQLGPYVGNALDFARFRQFMVDEVERVAPELMQIDALISAKEREVTASARGLYMPTVGLRAQLSHELDRAETEGLQIPGLPPEAFPEPPETSWNAALQVSVPIWSGGRRKAELGISRSGLEQLKLQRRAIANKVELRVRAGLQQVATTAVAIQLRRQAAAAAENNLSLVEDAYAKGVATSLDLLDAQSAAFVARAAAANAEYDFFSALMELQRASGRFDYFITPSERQAFFQRLEDYYRQFQ